ncbi:MAG: hypothetical protein PHT33_09415 [bacterium]|nr:hypothetical protein [bacterium]
MQGMRGREAVSSTGHHDLQRSAGHLELNGQKPVYKQQAGRIIGDAEYTVSWFQRGTGEDTEAHMIGKLLLAEIDLATAGRSSDKQIPGEVAALLKYIRSNILRG